MEDKGSVEGNVVFQFAIVADTHLGPKDGVSPSPWKTNRLANARAKAMIGELNARKPSFVIHLGDMVHPVPAQADYSAAAQRFQQIFSGLEAPLHFVPGNHDIGDKPTPWSPAAPVNEDFLNSYEAHFGDHFYSFDHESIHFIIMNSSILNSGLSVEERQWRWIEEELETNSDRRIFLFLHYPLYLFSEEEIEHADNLAQPARSRLLKLIRQHRVEAVFSAHVHNFFYDHDGVTEFYVSPTPTAIRHDYSELSSIAAAEEFGRNDEGKLGYFWVEVRRHGHVAHYCRTAGRTGGEAIEDQPGLPLHSKTVADSPLGVDLRGAWAQPQPIPITGALDEFTRKWVRNDYPLSAIWEMGIGWLRVPVEDITCSVAHRRMEKLRQSRLRFSVFVFGVPTDDVQSVLSERSACFDRLEIVVSAKDMSESLEALGRLRKAIGKPIYLSRLRTSTDEGALSGRYAHFIDCGFHVEDAPLLDCLGELNNFIDGLVFRTRPGQYPSSIAPKIFALSDALGLGSSLSVRMFGPDPAAHFGTTAETTALVCDALDVAYSAPSRFDVIFDTLIDVDRGYFPRPGLLDRRYNHTEISRALITRHKELRPGQLKRKAS